MSATSCYIPVPNPTHRGPYASHWSSRSLTRTASPGRTGNKCARSAPGSPTAIYPRDRLRLASTARAISLLPGLEDALKSASSELRSAHEARSKLSIRANTAERDLARVKESEAQLSARLEESRAAAALLQSRLQETIDDEANAASTLSEERDALRTRCDELGRRAALLEASRVEAEAALVRQREAYEEERQATDATSAVQREAIEKLRAEGERLREQVTRVEAEADASARAADEAAAAALSASSTSGDPADAAEIERLKGELAQAQAATRAAEEQAGMLKGSLAAMGKAQAQLKGQMDASSNADKQAVAALEQVRSLESQVKGTELALRSARADAKQQRGEAEALAEALAKERSASAELKAELVRSLESEREKAVASAERTAQAKLGRLQATLDEASAELEASKQFTRQLERERTSAQQAADMAQAQADKLTLECAAASRKAHSLESEVADLRSQVCAHLLNIHWLSALEQPSNRSATKPHMETQSSLALSARTAIEPQVRPNPTWKLDMETTPATRARDRERARRGSAQHWSAAPIPPPLFRDRSHTLRRSPP